jgi:DNA-binding XRE family transcriptional regulator
MVSDRPQRIRQIRAFLGLTQERFALLMGASGVSVNRWEQGKAEPSPFCWAIFELLEKAIRVRQADEMIRRLEATGALPEPLICMAVWLARPEGPPASLRRRSAPELDAGPPSSSSVPSGVSS